MAKKDETYYENLDKRTKEYRDWKAKRQKDSKGLGDTLEKAFKATGVSDVVKFVAGEDCGCSERRDKLNKIFKYKRPLCLLESEYVYLSDFFANPESTIRYKTQLELVQIYNRVFQQRRKPTSCGSCVNEIVRDLRTYYEKYND